MKPLPAIPISDLTFWNWVARNLANFEIVSAVPTVEKLKNGDAIIYESGSTRRLYVNINGTIRFLGINNANKIIDLDGDSWVEVERTADGDIVWIRTAGTDRIKIDESGNVFIGDAGITDYLKIEPDGTLEFNGNATVFDDLRVPVTSVRVPGSKAPTWVPYSAGKLLAFDYQAVAGNEEEISFVAQLPHSYKEGTNITPHVHWIPDVNDTGTARWGLIYEWVNRDGTFSGTTTIYADQVIDQRINDQVKTFFSAISGAGKTISSTLICTLFRNSSHVNDDLNGMDLLLLEIDFHFEMDMVGSRQILTK